MALKATVPLPAGTVVILFTMDTAIAACLIVKLSESDFDESCTEIAVNVGWLPDTDGGGE